MSAPLPGLAVWTDFGGVLTPPVDVTFRDFQARTGVPVHALKEAMRLVGEAHGTDSMGVLDIPLLSEPEWEQEVEQVLEHDFGLAADLSSFGDRWFAGRPANRDWLDALDALRLRGVFVGLLSNLPPSWERHRRHMVDDAHFDGIVCSYAVGSRKPEPEIFRIAAARAGREPRACVLVDDLDKNCAGAVAAGWQAVRFHDAAQAARQVEDLLRSTAPRPALR